MQIKIAVMSNGNLYTKSLSIKLHNDIDRSNTETISYVIFQVSCTIDQ